MPVAQQFVAQVDDLFDALAKVDADRIQIERVLASHVALQRVVPQDVRDLSWELMRAVQGLVHVETEALGTDSLEWLSAAESFRAARRRYAAWLATYMTGPTGT